MSDYRQQQENEELHETIVQALRALVAARTPVAWMIFKDGEKYKLDWTENTSMYRSSEPLYSSPDLTQDELSAICYACGIQPKDLA
jgi:hypothetical protein